MFSLFIVNKLKSNIVAAKSQQKQKKNCHPSVKPKLKIRKMTFIANIYQ